ncbi:hypothetical protein ACQR3W_21990 [Rhodococcus ruber]|uniref:Uncharacterized protein n=1 Tax=Rhodococcus ruber TaxID=1830 RepID=A0A098BLG6_9NOCA|nr:hypothetical protein [Rhodococcus ruber]MCZ4505920.1 hypothetical protein [Rhodococcus ruber]MCZ4533463.1 hypothetical protein [Rhodococcus ruber]CDZ89042.1 hypothetical protein RHRU231_450209 [Rhodococcus ruber]
MSLADDLDSTPIDQAANKGSIDVTPDGASVNNVVVDSPVNDDWSAVFALFNMSAAEFEVVDDTVRMSTWQQSRRTADGDRDVVQLYSYSARFRRKPKQRLSDAEVDERRAALRSWTVPTRTPSRNGTPVAAVVNLADIQGGKNEGGDTGVAATQQRLTDGLENVQAWLDRMREDHNITEIVIANNGDPIEGCDGSYANQLFSVELNTRQQYNFALDMWELYARTLFPQFDKAQFVSVLCNHGTMARLGTNKNRTDDSDNAGGFLAETLRRVLSGHEAFDHVQWTIPHDEMNVYPVVAGVPMAFNHGHQIPGSDASGFEKWLNGQVRGDAGAHRAKIWQTAHKHHFACWDMGSCTVFQAPSVDGGSKWLRDKTGKFSRSGILTYLVGEHSPLGWSDMAFL